MDEKQARYASVKPQLGALAGPLVERSQQLLRERGDFLPHAAVLTADGRVAMVGAMCNTRDGFANSWHILPLLHDGLRTMANERDVVAVGVSECVTEIPGGATGAAVRILLEHRRPFTMAIYLPFAKNGSGSVEFGRSVSVEAEPEVKVWTQGY